VAREADGGRTRHIVPTWPGRFVPQDPYIEREMGPEAPRWMQPAGAWESAEAKRFAEEAQWLWLRYLSTREKVPERSVAGGRLYEVGPPSGPTAFETELLKERYLARNPLLSSWAPSTTAKAPFPIGLLPSPYEVSEAWKPYVRGITVLRDPSDPGGWGSAAGRRMMIGARQRKGTWLHELAHVMSPAWRYRNRPFGPGGRSPLVGGDVLSFYELFAKALAGQQGGAARRAEALAFRHPWNRPGFTWSEAYAEYPNYLWPRPMPFEMREFYPWLETGGR